MIKEFVFPTFDESIGILNDSECCLIRNPLSEFSDPDERGDPMNNERQHLDFSPERCRNGFHLNKFRDEERLLVKEIVF